MNQSRQWPFIALVLILAGGVAGSGPANAESQPPALVPPTDPGIHYVGRWDRSDATLSHSYWGGAYLRAGFTGTAVGIKLAAGTALVVSIDDEPFRQVNGGPGILPLNTSPLKAGTHSLLVGAAGQNEEVLFQGLDLDSGAALTQASPARPLIEFVGDSITTATGSPVGTTNWAWNSAEALGCDHVQIAFSGLSPTSKFGCLEKKVGLDQLYLLEKNYNHLDETPLVPWNFSYTPDVIVINLGQNDQCGAEPAATMQASYLAFLRMLRQHFPQAHIVAIQPFSRAYADSIRAAAHTVIAAGDKNVQFVNTTDWLRPDDTADGIHPNFIGNLKVMGRLVAILRPLLPSHATER